MNPVALLCSASILCLSISACYGAVPSHRRFPRDVNKTDAPKTVPVPEAGTGTLQEVVKPQNETRIKKDTNNKNIKGDIGGGELTCVNVRDDNTGRLTKVCGPKVESEKPTKEEAADKTTLATPLAVDKQRSATYPISGGYGYHTIGEVFHPVPHYPWEFPYPQYSKFEPVTRAKNAEDTAEEEEVYLPKQTARAINSLSQKLDELQNKLAMYDVQSSTPLQQQQLLYNRAAESLKDIVRTSAHHSQQPTTLVQPVPVQVSSSVDSYSQSAHQPIAVHAIQSQPLQPAVHYSTQYVLEKPIPQVLQPAAQMVPTVSRIPVTLQCEIKPVIAAYDIHGRANEFSNDPMYSYPSPWQPMSQVPTGYLSQLSSDSVGTTYPSSSGYMPLDYLKQLGRCPTEQSQQFVRSSEGDEQQIVGDAQSAGNQLDGTVSPGDRVYMEGPYMPKSSMEEDMATASMYPNYRQQFRNMQIQYYHDEMMKNAAELERRAEEIADEKRAVSATQNLNEAKKVPPVQVQKSRAVPENEYVLKTTEDLIKESEARLENLRSQLKKMMEEKEKQTLAAINRGPKQEPEPQTQNSNSSTTSKTESAVKEKVEEISAKAKSAVITTSKSSTSTQKSANNAEQTMTSSKSTNQEVPLKSIFFKPGPKENNSFP